LLVDQLRRKGAIIFAKAVNTEYNGRAGDPGGRHKPDKVLPSTLAVAKLWAAILPIPMTRLCSASLDRAPARPLSRTNMVMASQARKRARLPRSLNQCRGADPAWAMLGFDGGAIARISIATAAGFTAAPSSIAPRCSML
jgi:hypothetical protein